MGKSKAGFSENLSGWIEEKMAPVLIKIFDRPMFNIIKDAILGTMPAIMIGSIVLILSLLGTNQLGTNEPILKFLVPYVESIQLIYGYTLGAMTLYFVIALGIRYAQEYNLDTIMGAEIAIASLLSISLKGGIGDIAVVAGSGALFMAMFTTYFALWIYKICIKKNICIKLPKGVPPMVASSFSTIIPISIVVVLYWFIRAIMNIDLVALSSTLFSGLFRRLAKRQLL
jgi:PTS system cellobiose-specific IIC component